MLPGTLDSCRCSVHKFHSAPGHSTYIAHPNRSLALLERIPRYTEARREITFRCFHDVLAIRRSSGSAKTQRLEVLTVNNQAVAIRAGAGNAIARACNLRRECRVEDRWIEV